MAKVTEGWPAGDRPDELRAWLEERAEESYRRFSSSLLPPEEGATMLGVRLPLLRRLAARLAKGDWTAYLAAARDDSFEEILLQGMVIGTAPAPLPVRLEHTARFVPKIRNWSVCDSFCAGLKTRPEEREELAAFLTPYFSSPREFDVRFGVVMRLFYFIDETWLDETLALLRGVTHEGYYARMAVAWAASVGYAAFPEKTERFLQSGALTGETYRKALQKILESRQVDETAKARIRTMRAEAGKDSPPRGLPATERGRIL